MRKSIMGLAVLASLCGSAVQAAKYVVYSGYGPGNFQEYISGEGFKIGPTDTVYMSLVAPLERPCYGPRSFSCYVDGKRLVAEGYSNTNLYFTQLLSGFPLTADGFSNGWATEYYYPNKQVSMSVTHLDVRVIDADPDSYGGGWLSLSMPVPEPASWALMIGGFGLLGAALRRKTQAFAHA